MNTLSMFKPVRTQVEQTELGEIVTIINKREEMKKYYERYMKEIEVKDIEKDKRMTYVEAKRESTNKEAIQQSFLIHLLITNGYTIKIGKIYKRSDYTRHVFKIEEIRDSEDYLIYEIDEKIKEIKDMKLRRRKIDSEANEIMIKEIEKLGGEIKLRRTKGCKIYEPIKRIKSIKIGEIKFKKDEIQYIGKKMNDYITLKVKENSCIFEKKEDIINL